MLLPRLLLPALCLLVTQVISENNDAPCIPSTAESSSKASCQKIRRAVQEEQPRVSSKRVFKRQAGRANLGGCGDSQLSQIMQHVASPLLSRSTMRLGDIAQILQQSVQRATGKSHEIIMGRGDFMIASHSMSDASSCKMRVGEYYTKVYETPVQYDINNVAEETIMSNIDFGEDLGGSGYPGQTPFPYRVQEPLLLDAAPQLVDGSAQLLEPPPQLVDGTAQLLQPPPQLLSPPQFVQQPPYWAPSPPAYAPAYATPFPVMECFSGDLIVETIEGPKRMSELKRGDEVMSVDENTITFSPIIMFLHRDEALLTEFNVITVANRDSVKLTNEHLIYVFDCDPTSSFQLVRAKEVTTEHCLMVASSSTRMLTMDRVTNVTKVYERGIYAPLTSTGDIIVNDILSSCHSNLAVRSLQDSFFKVYRYLSFLIPERGELPLGLEYFIKTLDLFVPIKAVLG